MKKNKNTHSKNKKIKKTRKKSLSDISKKALLGKAANKKIKSKNILKIKNITNLKKYPLIKQFISFIKKFINNSLFRYSILAIFFCGLAVFAYFVKDLPSPRRLTSQENFAVSTQIFDRNGQLLYEIYADENRIPINIEDLPPHVLQATIAIEDKNFYTHWRFDYQVEH